MSLAVIPTPDYSGAAGISELHAMQLAMLAALESQDWLAVKRLDKSCAALVDKVIAANIHDPRSLLAPLGELKIIYRSLLWHCHEKVASMAV